MKVLDPTTIHPALQPNYSNTWDPVSTTKREDSRTSRPYVPSDKLIWSGNPVITSFSGTPEGLPRAGTAMRRLGERSMILGSLFGSGPLNRNIGPAASSPTAPVDMNPLLAVMSPVGSISEPPLTLFTTEVLSVAS
jgi:hypothetical protein